MEIGEKNEWNARNGIRMWGISVGVREMRGYTENAENLCGDAGNQGGNLGIAVEMA